MALREAQRHHSPVGGADDGMQRLQAQMLDDGAQGVGLVVGAERRELAAGPRRGTVAAAAEIIDAQNPVLARIHAQAGTDEFGPPSIARGTRARGTRARGGARDHPVGGDAAEHGNDGPVLGTHEPKGDFCIRQDVAVMHLEGLVQPQGLVDQN